MPKIRRFTPEGPTPYTLPAYPATEELTRHEMRQNRRANRERTANTRGTQILGSLAVGTIATISLGAQAFIGSVQEGIAEGKEAIRGDRATVAMEYDYPDDDESLFSKHATVVLTGLGTKDSAETARGLEAHRDVGDVFSVSYSDQELNIDDIAQQIIEQARQKGIKALSLDGYSAGGKIGLATAARIHEYAPDIHVISVILNSTPMDEASLTEHSRRGLKLMNWFLNIHPDLIYYEDGRKIIELINRSDRYTTEVPATRNQLIPSLISRNTIEINGKRYTIDYERMLHELDDISRRMDDPAVASANLIKNQADIVRENMEQYVRSLSKPKPGSDSDALPLLVLTVSRNAQSDSVVDVNATQTEFDRQCKQYNTNCKVIHEDIGHANPGERRREYARMISQVVQPETKRVLVENAQSIDPHLFALSLSKGIDVLIPNLPH